MLKKLIRTHQRHATGPGMTLLLLIALSLGLSYGFEAPPPAQAAGGPAAPLDLVVRLEGPQAGETGTAYPFTAIVEPDPGAEPVTYTWEVTDQATQVNTGGASDTVSYTWETGGVKSVQVTASSAAGTGMAELEILVRAPRRVFFPSLQRACAPLLYEDFSDPASDWPVVENESVQLGYHQDEYRMLIKESEMVVGVNSGAVLTPQSSLEVTLRNPSGVYGSYGLLFGLAEDFSQTYVYEIYPDGWYALWFYQQNIGWSLLQAEEVVQILPAAGGDHLRIEFLEGRAQIYANEQLLTLLPFNPDGVHVNVGIFASSFDWGGVDVRFDDFRLTTRSCDGTAASRYPAALRSAADYREWER